MGTNVTTQLDTNFDAVVKRMISELGAIASSVTSGSNIRPWFLQIGKEYDDQNDAENRDTIHDALQRNQANDNYERVRKENLSRNDLLLAKIQSDFMAGCERDYRARHRTRVRLMAHAAAKKLGMSLPFGPLHTNTIGFIARRKKITEAENAP